MPDTSNVGAMKADQRFVVSSLSRWIVFILYVGVPRGGGGELSVDESGQTRIELRAAGPQRQLSAETRFRAMDQHSQIRAVYFESPADLVLVLLLQKDEPKQLAVLLGQRFKNSLDL